MFSPNVPEELMQSILQPLLEDFEHWFQRSLDSFESESIVELTAEQRTDLLERIQAALSEVKVASSLLQATNGQVGVEASKVMTWHRLVHECWEIAYRHRYRGSGDSGDR